MRDQSKIYDIKLMTFKINAKIHDFYNQPGIIEALKSRWLK